MIEPLLIAIALLFAFGCYLQLRIELTYSAYLRLGRPVGMPSLAVMALHPRHQLRWSARQWSRWALGRLVIL